MGISLSAVPHQTAAVPFWSVIQFETILPAAQRSALPKILLSLHCSPPDCQHNWFVLAVRLWNASAAGQAHVYFSSRAVAGSVSTGSACRGCSSEAYWWQDFTVDYSSSSITAPSASVMTTLHPAKPWPKALSLLIQPISVLSKTPGTFTGKSPFSSLCPHYSGNFCSLCL